MEIFVNDLSIHGQFQSTADFHAAFERLTAMRKTAKRYGRELYCNQAILADKPTPSMTMLQALRSLNKDRRNAAMSWLTKGGPFWDALRRHSPDDYMECRGDPVTDSAVGEAAYRVLHDVPCGLVSVVPSDWDFSPVKVVWRREDEGLNDRNAALENWLDAAALENGLRAADPPFHSWDDLRKTSTGGRFARLIFADDCFDPLDGHPFAKSSADRIYFLLKILDRLAGAFDSNGIRTPEGRKIYQDYFTGGKSAWFSDSSDKEKNNKVFRRNMTFPHPDIPGKSLFCPWHGKERHKNLRLRLHHSWPVEAGEPVYVVYVGPKLTIR